MVSRRPDVPDDGVLTRAARAAVETTEAGGWGSPYCIRGQLPMDSSVGGLGRPIKAAMAARRQLTPKRPALAGRFVWRLR